MQKRRKCLEIQQLQINSIITKTHRWAERARGLAGGQSLLTWQAQVTHHHWLTRQARPPRSSAHRFPMLLNKLRFSVLFTRCLFLNESTNTHKRITLEKTTFGT